MESVRLGAPCLDTNHQVRSEKAGVLLKTKLYLKAQAADMKSF